MRLATRAAWVVPVLAIVLFAAVPLVAYAQDGMDDSTASASGSGGSGSESSGSGSSSTTRATEQEDANDDSATSGKNRMKLEDAKKDFQNRAQSRGSELLDKARKSKEAEALSNTERIQKCESRKQGLDQKLANIVKNAQKYQTRVDNVFAKAKSYATDSKVEIANWDTLVAAAADAQTKAKASVDVLGTLKTTVNCNSETVASDVATFKAAVQQAREDLQAYRKSVKAVVSAIREAKEATTAPTTDNSATRESN